MKNPKSNLGRKIIEAVKRPVKGLSRAVPTTRREKTENGWYARVCINPKKPCGLVEVTPKPIKVNSDEICVPCTINYGI